MIPSPDPEPSWEARALAAERTVDVLKRKIIDLYNGGGSSIQRTLERARVREAESRRRQELMALRNAELLNYSARLEAEVAARTRELQTILDNVVFGFLVVGGDFTVKAYTRSCTELLTAADLANRPLAEALGFDAREACQLELALTQVFDDLLPSELTVEQLPHAANGRDGRRLRLDGRVIRAADGAVDTILLTISDVTQLEAAQRENEHYRLVVQLLRQRDAFATFLTDFHALATDARIALAGDDQRLARRAVHTMKGNAGCFGLASLAARIHDLEERPAIDLDAIDVIELELAAFLEANADVLGTSCATDPTRIVIDGRTLDALASATSLASVAAWVQDVRRRPARAMLAPFDGMVRRLAERCEKAVELVIEGGDLRVDGELLAPVVRELGHVVRNAIDHGIEPPDARGAKPSPARITMRVAETADGYQLDVEDDGRGIDVARLVAKATAMGVPAAELAARSHDELLELVFIDGLTTAATATDVSGRGVGMSALAAAVRHAGGAVRLHSFAGRGTRIEIRLPGPRPAPPVRESTRIRVIGAPAAVSH